MSTVSYEWDIETVDISHTDNPNDQDIIDHEFFNKCPGLPNEPDKRLVLVRDANMCRAWAYVTKNNKLPQYFEDAYQCTTTVVPKRFHAELEKVNYDQNNRSIRHRTTSNHSKGRNKKP